MDEYRYDPERPRASWCNFAFVSFWRSEMGASKISLAR
jgi:hypothetical protein